MKVFLPILFSVVAIYLLVAVPVSEAAFYQWTDKSGVTHFTDNLSKVPPQQRKSSKKKLAPLPALSAANPSSAVKGARNKDWREKCASCHHVGKGMQGERIGLSGSTINASSRFPETVQDLVKKLRFAANGRYSDMPRVDVSDDELQAIAKYLLSKNK